MAIKRIEIDVFFQLAKEYPVLDARSPAEYQHAHIPGALSFPLFSDEERKIVGTAYKQQSREKAIKIGLTYFGPKMVSLVEQAELITKHNPGKKLLVHCWRGGMRSAAIAWLLDLYGFEVYTLVGGYKAFRHLVLEQFDLTYAFNVIGGYTGSGKTHVLKELANIGKSTIDLEGLASHKGSAFGSIHMASQPSQEMFENLLALALLDQSKTTAAQEGIWVEDESQRIGNLNIPTGIWNQIRSSPLYFLQIDFEKRLEHIVADYGKGDKEKLVNAIIRIQKRLGGLETKTAINFLLEDNLAESFRILLKYYDKQYEKGLYNRANLDKILHNVPAEEINAKELAKRLNTLPGNRATENIIK